MVTKSPAVRGVFEDGEKGVCFSLNTVWQGHGVFLVQSEEPAVFAHAARLVLSQIPNWRGGHSQYSHVFHVLPHYQQQLVLCHIPNCSYYLSPVLIPRETSNWEDLGHGNPKSAIPLRDELSLSSRLPSAETALSPSGSLWNTRLLTKHG